MQTQSMTKKIKTDAGALCFWSWNDSLEKEELRRQMEDFSKERFAGVLIHSRSGLRIPYMGKEWFDCYRFAVREAKRLGLEIWIYDEDGWPSGFAGGQVPALGEKHWLKELHFSENHSGNFENRIAAWRKTEDGYYPIPKDSADKGDLVCWYTADKNYVDLLSCETVKCFIEKTHERYKKELGDDFGGVIKGVFTDEPQIKPYPWSFSLEEAWLSRYHEPITDKLYLLVKEEAGFESFRWRFRDLVSDLLYNSFTKQIADWCEQNGLIFTGHFSEEDGLAMQIRGNCGVMRHYSAMQLPGIDHLGNRNTSPLLLKQPSSVAHQLGKSDVLSETYGCAGWQITFDRLCSIWGRQSVLGITKPCFHLSAYSITGRRKRDYPAFYSYQEPWWEEFPAVMKWINGLNSLMKEGERLTDVLVISPLAGVSASYGTKTAEKISCEFRCLVENLLDAQVDVELGDEKIISEYGGIQDGMFCIGNVGYRLVIVPETSSLSGKTVSLLREFAQRGGKIWYAGNSVRKEDFDAYEMPAGEVVQNRRGMLEKCFAYIGYRRPVTISSAEDLSLLHGALVHTRHLNGAYRSHIWTGSDFRTGRARICLYAPDGENTVYYIDIFTKNRVLLPAVRDGDFLTVYTDMSADCNIVLEWKKSDETAAIPEKRLCCEYYADDCTVRLETDNALTLDYAEISVNEKAFTDEKPVVRMLRGLYEEREKFPAELPMPVRLCYRFKCAADLDVKGIKAVIENEFVRKIEVNGNELSGGVSGWWIDRKFGEYDIGDYLQAGENTIVLHYDLPNAVNGTETEGFESERNRFFFPVEPESIYIKGNFDVVSTASVTNRGSCYRIDGKMFSLSPPTEKQMGDITEQNAWFYRGNAEYTFRVYRRADGVRYKILPEDAKGVGAEVIICGKRYVMLSLKEPLDITDALSEEENTVVFRLLGHNRNLLGPHHHIKGETAMVGPDTFEGQLGFEDFVSPEIKSDNTWTDSYHFIPFGCGGFRIIEEKNRK